MEINSILVHPQDNVAVVVKALKAGEKVLGVAGDRLTATQDVPKHHKVALRAIPVGAKIIKYGESIGIASQAITPGDWVHTHNVKAED
jgi:altronate hydrolase